MRGTGPRRSGSGIIDSAAPAGSGRGGAHSALPRILVLAAFSVVVLTAFALWTTEDRLSDAPTLCPLRASTGLYCPGCGATRATAALLHADVGRAVGFNPLAAVAAPFLLYASLKQAARMLSGRAIRRRHVPSRYIWGLLVVVLAYSVLRNLPWFPFSLLAP